jgi:hypothetical protein
MTFTIVYKTVNIIYLGENFTSSHTIDSDEESNIIYQATYAEGVIFNEKTGDFIIESDKITNINFIITVTSSSGWGYEIPINIKVIDSCEKENNLQYFYQTCYPFFSNFLIEKSGPQIPDAKYSLVGAPDGIFINNLTGELSGFSISSGKFILRITAFDSFSGDFIGSSKIEIIFYNQNKITNITFTPSNSFMASNTIPLTIKCKYQGHFPNLGNNYNISSRAISDSFLAEYKVTGEVSEELTFLYIITITNNPGSYPIKLIDTSTGFFLISQYNFVVTAACFNEDTTILVYNNCQEIYKVIKELNVGDEIITYKHGIKKITHIGSKTMINNPESVTDCMYKLPINNKIYSDLSHDLILLGRHSILVDELTPKQKRKINEIHPVDHIDDKCLLNIMFNDDFEIINDTNEYTYYHFVLEQEKDRVDRRYGVYVNGSEIIAATSYKTDFLKQFTNKNK